MPNSAEPSKAPRVLAIVVNWNKKPFLEALLRGLEGLERSPDEILVVDNASTDGSPEMVREAFPGVRLICNERNVGGSGGFNTGLRWGLENGAFDYFWMLDNDIVVHERALEALVEVAEADARVGMVGSRIAELGRPERTQEVGARIFWPRCTLDKLGAQESFAEPGRGGARLFDADYVASCSLLARVAAIEEVGIWDQGYFVFFDDIDWGVRFGRAGWRVRATSDSVVEHESFHERRLVQGPGALHLSLRNGLYFMHLFCPPRLRPLLLFRVFFSILIDVARFRRDGRDEARRGLQLAVRDFFASERGKPKHTFGDDSLVARFSGEAAAPVPARKGRLLVWTTSASPATERSIERIREQYPDHKVEIFAPAEIEEMDGFLGDALIRRPTRAPLQRLALARWAWARYDATIHHEKLTRLLFEHGFPVAIWFDDAGNTGVARNSWKNIAGILLGRPLVFVGAWWLTLRALLKKRPHVDYFTWNRRARGDSKAG